MASASNETTVLVLRDSQGATYVLPEATIRACQATPEQQQALQQLIGEDVQGYAATGGGLVALGAITVAPQINTNVGFNVAAGNFAPVNQVLGQTGINAFSGVTRLHA
jgi:hypothetical protein